MSSQSKQGNPTQLPSGLGATLPCGWTRTSTGAGNRKCGAACAPNVHARLRRAALVTLEWALLTPTFQRACLRGTSGDCDTFRSKSLSTTSDFEIAYVELWGFD